MKLPKTLYVRIEKDTDGSDLFFPTKTPDGYDGEKVGVYRLVEVKTRKIVESLV